MGGLFQLELQHPESPHFPPAKEFGGSSFPDRMQTSGAVSREQVLGQDVSLLAPNLEFSASGIRPRRSEALSHSSVRAFEGSYSRKQY
jgi:hypothetical protein